MNRDTSTPRKRRLTITDVLRACCEVKVQAKASIQDWYKYKHCLVKEVSTRVPKQVQKEDDIGVFKRSNCLIERLVQ